MKQFRGCHTVTVTPFTEDGRKIDVKALRRFLDWQHQSKVPGVIVLGTTGEFLTETRVDTVTERQTPRHDSFDHGTKWVELIGPITPHERIAVGRLDIDRDE